MVPANQENQCSSTDFISSPNRIFLEYIQSVTVK
uniref:Uncharacterized protein n=1 Tax=Rhizophora mucronata TaxID=61149 RepID=A0A2P2PF54_RHIMU